jgi:selenocysteine-specific elongation factor
MILGTAGHIDHGKTSLVRALTGVDTDRLPEEKRRGITIELGFAPLRLPGGATLGVVDVPGHEAFVRTMVAGATGIDLALLVIAADEGVMPQTREHLAILTLLGVRGGVVALTKCDLVDDDWRALVLDDVLDVLAGTPLERSPIVPVSAVTGVGLDDLRAALAGVAQAIPGRDASDLFRMPIDRVFTVTGTGTVVTGTIWSGVLHREDPVIVLPQGIAARVRALQHHGTAADAAGPGTRTAVALSGVNADAVSRGAVLVADASWSSTRRFLADVALLPDTKFALRPRASVHLHVGTSDVMARVVAIGGALQPGDRKPVRVTVDEALVLRSGDRFVLRAGSPPETVGGGVVEDPFPTHRRARPRPRAASAPDRLRAVLLDADLSGVALRDLPVRIGSTPADVDLLVASAEGGGVVRIGDRCYLGAVIERVRSDLLMLLDAYHRDRPLDAGASLSEVRGRLAPNESLAEFVIRVTVDRRDIDVFGGVVRRAGWTEQLSPVLRRAMDEVAASIRGAGREPGSVQELIAQYGDDVPDLLRLLERRGSLIRVGEDRYYDRETLAEIVVQLRRELEPGRRYLPGALRDVIGVTRKFLIPLLEYLDRTGITERGEEGRVLRRGE